MQRSDRWTNCTSKYEGNNPEPHLQVIPLPNFQRKVFLRCCKNLRFWRGAWKKNKKTFYEPNPSTPRDFLVTSWPEGLLSRLFFTNQSQCLCWNSVLKRLNTNNKESTVAIRYCALYTCTGISFKKVNGVFEGWFKLSSAALNLIISYDFSRRMEGPVSHMCHIH